jgi:low affinity Fe/Cu permease
MPGPQASVISRALHAVDEWSGRAWLAGVVAALTVAALVGLVLSHASDRAYVLYTVVIEAVTLVLVFVVQHTQNRHQKVMQRKLDEVVAALGDADDRMVHLEHASDEEIEQQSKRHRDARVRAT